MDRWVRSSERSGAGREEIVVVMGGRWERTTERVVEGSEERRRQ